MCIVLDVSVVFFNFFWIGNLTLLTDQPTYRRVELDATMAPPKNLAIVRKIVALALLSGGDSLKGILFSAAQIVVFVNFVLATVGGDTRTLELTEDDIRKSFANRGGEVDYPLPISALCGDEFANASDFLCARTSFREDKSSSRTTAIGIFPSLEEATDTKIVQKKSTREFEAAVGDTVLVTAEQKEGARRAVEARTAEAARKKRKAKEVEQQAEAGGGLDDAETAEQPPETITPPSQSSQSSQSPPSREAGRLCRRSTCSTIISRE